MTESDTDLTVHFLPDYTPTNPYQERLAAALQRRGVTVRVSDGGGSGLPILRALWARGIPDVVHVHFLHQFVTSSSTRFPTPVAFLLSIRTIFELTVVKLLGVSLVWTAHDLVNHEQRTTVIEVAFKHILLRYLTDHIIVHCEAAVDAVVEFYHLPESTTKIMTVVPHGSFADDYPNEVSQMTARNRLNLPRDSFVFTFFGSIRRYKNVPHLIETFSGLDTDAKLLIAGNPRTEAIERDVRDASASVDGVQTALEFVPADEVQLYLNAADIVVLPFRADEASMLTSGSVLLAMSFGRPVIAPDIGCIAEYVGDEGGYVYNPATEGSLRRAMRASLSGDLDAMGRHNDRWTAKLTWDRMAERTHAVYTAGVDDGESDRLRTNAIWPETREATREPER